MYLQKRQSLWFAKIFKDEGGLARGEVWGMSKKRNKIGKNEKKLLIGLYLFKIFRIFAPFFILFAELITKNRVTDWNVLFVS